MDKSDIVRHTISINLLKEKRSIFNDIENLVFAHDGSIYGGYVRDTLISEYYTKKFYDRYETRYCENCDDLFWDETYIPKLKARCLIPNDMNILFTNDNYYYKFIAILKEDFNNKVFVLQDKYPHLYSGDNIMQFRNVNIKINLGSTYTSEGIELNIQIDIKFPTKYSMILLISPITNLDMLCNGFIKSKTGITFTKNTGTILDFKSEIERTAAIRRIQSDMIKFRTYVCMKLPYKNDIEYNPQLLKFYNNVVKMVNKKYPWEIMNLPYYTRYNSVPETMECCICQEKINKDDFVSTVPVIKFNKNSIGSKTHKTCLERYILYQINEECKIDIKCPYKNLLCFNECHKKINYRKIII